MSGLWNMLEYWAYEYYSRRDRTKHFYNLAAAASATSFVIAFLYLMYMVSAAVAVHRWRMGKRKTKEAWVELARRNRGQEEGPGDNLSERTVTAK
jgi:hypothetical protein